MRDQRKTAAKSVRELVTLQTLAHGAQPLERHQQVNRFVHLENERARLERELGMWEARASATRDRLRQIYQQIDAMRWLLNDEKPSPPDDRQTAVGRRVRTTLSDGYASPSAHTRNMSIDY